MILFLDYIPVKSRYYRKNDILHVLFDNFLLHINQIMFSLQTWVVLFNYIGVITTKCMKNDLRYGCGFHTPKNTKMFFSSEIGRFDISFL